MKKRRRGAACRRLPQRTQRRGSAVLGVSPMSDCRHKEIRVLESFCVSPIIIRPVETLQLLVFTTINLIPFHEKSDTYRFTVGAVRPQYGSVKGKRKKGKGFEYILYPLPLNLFPDHKESS